MGLPSAFIDTKVKLGDRGIVQLADFGKDTQQHFKVARLKNEQLLTILNGQGESWLLEKQEQQFFVRSHRNHEKLSPEIHLFLSPPAGDALSQTVQQSTEVGVASFHFFRSEFCQWKKSKDLNLERLQRVASAACAQCSQPWLPSFDPTPLQSLEQALSHSEGPCFIADEDTHKEALLYKEQLETLRAKTKNSGRLNLFVGPEGGWSPGEHKLIDQKCEKISLGPLVLRVPTACVAGLTLLRQMSQ